MNEETKRTFVKKGNKLIVKTNVPKMELDSRDVLYQIEAYEQAIEKNLHDIEQLKNALKVNEEGIVKNRSGLKNIEHYREWATKVQESRCKAIIDQNKGEAEKAIRETYVYDEGMTEEQNKAQMFVQYQRKLATLKEVADEIHPSIMKDWFYKKGYLNNPFKV